MAISVEVNVVMNKWLKWRVYIAEADGYGMPMGIFILYILLIMWKTIWLHLR